MRISLFLLALCLCLLPCLGSLAQEPADDETDVLELPTFSVLQKTETVELKVSGEQEFTVKYPPILRNTEQLTEADGNTLVRNVDYQIDLYSGKITIAPRGTTTYPYRLKITYRTLPFAIKEVYKRDLYGEQNLDSHQSSADSDQPSAVGVGLPNPLSTDEETSSLRGEPGSENQLEVSGSQTFGISLGSGRSVTPNQELRVNVEGKASKDITVLALLSDQDLPIQPEGTTENIQDIDQKLIRITHPNMSGTLGDFEGSLGASEFIFFPRALEGVQVEGDFEWGRFHLIPSAIPKGQSTSLVLRGEEGRSEYRLTVDGQYVIVKAGSEIVWLNGERMRRGENNDYIIREYGDPIVEFNSKHLITSNDTIRIDFEYISEERAYQQNLYGLSSTFTLPGDRISIGASYAVETDLKEPDQALIAITETDLEALRQNIIDPEEGRLPLIAPQQHTVWGVESRLNITEKAWIEGELAYSNLDRNTYSTVDRKEVSQAWKLIGAADWDFATSTDKRNRASRPLLHTNLDIRSMDADFVPVGASSSNRSRSRYETQYAKEGFDDAFLFDSAGFSRTAQDERTVNFDIRLTPIDWLAFDAGVGRSEEREPQRTETVTTQTDALSTRNATIRNNFNWGINFNQLAGRREVTSPLPRTNSQGSSTSTQSARPETPKTSLLKKLPNLRWDDYRSSSRIEGGDSTRAQSQQKSRQEGNLSYPIGPFRFVGTLGRLESTEALNASLNRKRDRSIGRIDLVDFSWLSVNTSYELEEAFAKEPLLTVDDEPIGLSDWQRSTTARTWKVGLFSQQKSFLGGGVNLRANLARRMLEAHTEFGSNTTTQLADINLQLTPLSRAVDIELRYELDKKLTSQRHEIYTNIHPHTGVLLQPGEGYYVKLDDLHYVEDPEEGTYIKIYQNVGDKPTTAVDADFRIRFQPRQYFARRARARQQQQQDLMRTGDSLRPTRNSNQPLAVSDQQENVISSATSLLKADSRKPKVSESHLAWFLSALRGQIRFWLTEEQEVEDAVSLYLLQSLQGSDTLFGRLNQHHRLEFSPSPAFSLEFNLRSGETLNKRINNQERHRQHRTWDAAFSMNPTQRLSVGANYEQRQETERYNQFNFENLGQEIEGEEKVTDRSATPISDLHQLEQTTELNLRYQLSNVLRWSGIGGYRQTTDEEQLDEEPEAKTRTFSYQNRITYSLIGKGRIDVNYKLGYGQSSGGIPFAQYTFYEGISHEIRTTADYRLRRFTDLLFRLNYRLLSTKHRKPEHRLEMTVSAEL